MSNNEDGCRSTTLHNKFKIGTFKNRRAKVGSWSVRTVRTMYGTYRTKKEEFFYRYCTFIGRGCGKRLCKTNKREKRRDTTRDNNVSKRPPTAKQSTLPTADR